MAKLAQRVRGEYAIRCGPDGDGQYQQEAGERPRAYSQRGIAGKRQAALAGNWIASAAPHHVEVKNGPPWVGLFFARRYFGTMVAKPPGAASLYITRDFRHAPDRARPRS